MTTQARRDGRIFLLLSSTLFLLASLAMAGTRGAGVVDFRAVYFAARCVLHGQNPYDERQFLKVYGAEGGDRAEDSPQQRKVVTRYINLPSGLLIFAPLALLPWSVAHVVWVALIALAMTVAAWLIWGQAADAAPILAASLLSLFLLTSILLVDVGNTAGLVVALIAIAVCLLLERRWVAIAVGCMAISLVIKPHDAGFVWLYFLLTGGAHRRAALWTLALAVALGLPGAIWMSRVAPHWPQELRRNLAETAMRGDINDPGPESASAHSADFIVDLRTVMSVVWDEPRFYSPAALLITAPLILWWIAAVARARDGGTNAWLALATISALTLLPIYHRQDDARLLLLTIPACALLWRAGGRVGKAALGMTLTALLLNGDTPTVLREHLAKPLLAGTQGAMNKILTILLDRPVPLILLAVGIFYLFAYAQQVKLRTDKPELARESQ